MFFFSHVDDTVRTFIEMGAQWEAFSDGGCRGDGKSAYAWIVYAVMTIGQRRHRFTVVFGYELVRGNYSSLITELWGLEQALGSLKQVLSL